MSSDWAANKAEELAKVLDEIPWRQKNDRYAIIEAALRDAARVPEEQVASLRRWMKSQRRADDCPAGYEPVQAYTNGKEIVVIGQPEHDDHNCDAMGCGQNHVIARIALAQPTPARGEGENVTCEHDIIRTACPTCNIWASTHRPKEPAND